MIGATVLITIFIEGQIFLTNSIIFLIILLACFIVSPFKVMGFNLK
jgi:uncharacterized protein (UPF0333 family)